MLMRDRLKKTLNDRTTLFVGLYIAGLIFYYLNPFDSIELTEWERSFGPASMKGLSIEKRVLNIYINYYLLLPITAFLGICSARIVIGKNESQKKAVRDISFINTFALIAAYTSRFASGTELVISINSVVTSALTFIIAIAVASLIHIDDNFEYEDYIISYVNHLIISLGFILPFQADERTIGYFYAISVLVTLLDMWILKISTMLQRKELFYFFWKYAYYGAALWVCVVEGMYIMASIGYIILHPFRILLTVIAVFAAVCLLISWKKKNTGLDKFSYTGVILSVGIMSLLENQYKILYDVRNYANLFEVGNVSVSLETIERGKIPIIDYFSAHAIRDVLSSLLYWMVGGDARTAIFSNPWQSLSQILGILFLYFILTRIFNRNWVILITLIFPLVIPNTFWGELALIAVIGLLFLVKNPEKLSSYLLFWLAIGVCCFTRYDSGISVGLSCILTATLLVVMKNMSARRYIYSFILVAFPTLVFYICYSIIKNFDWIGRIDEWMDVGAKSSATWATITFGNPSSLKFFIIYELFPSLDVAMIIITIILLILNRTARDRGALALTFSLSYSFMITRTLVYHNLEVTKTGWTGVIINFFPLAVFFFCIYICELFPKKISSVNCAYLPLCAFGISLALSVFIIGEKNPDEYSSIYGRGVGFARQFDVRKMQLPVTEDNNRTEYSEYTKSVYLPFERIFNLLLTDDQTFVDFANITGLYALTDREYPCYVSQTPSLLSNLSSQEHYIEEIKSSDAPLAIIGNKDLDFTMYMQEVRHNIKYYKVAEYIFENYRPLTMVGTDFALWCRNDNYELYHSILGETMMEDDCYIPIEPGYDADNHSYKLEDIPYIWANFDSDGAVNNEIICLADDIDHYMMDGRSTEEFSYDFPGGLEKQNGQYIFFEYTGVQEEATATLRVSENGMYPYEFSFKVKPERNKYLIRLSCDYFWYSFEPNIATFSTDDEDGCFSNVAILMGD
ncbi:hypothetical protein SAMN02910368_01829 [Lachnospiraceae bacterium G11]|nr:hypothetical protein SAMN02910368_01829 [Lachnospiraceae bacterium G11]